MEGEVPVAEVYIQDGESLESALRRFKRQVQHEDIIKEIKRHAFYLKPGQRKRVKAALARKRDRKKRNRDGEPEQIRSLVDFSAVPVCTGPSLRNPFQTVRAVFLHTA